MKTPLHFALFISIAVLLLVTICYPARSNAGSTGGQPSIKRRLSPQHEERSKKIKRMINVSASPATVERHSSKHEVDVPFGAMLKYYNDEEEGIYWRFPNVSPELSHITKELTAIGKRNPLGHHCAELALRVNWLFWWNLNEIATRKEHEQWRQQLLKTEGLLDKIQPKNVQNFEACVRGVQQFVDWQLDLEKERNLVLEEESEQFLRQIHGEMTALMGKHHYDAMQSSNKFEQSFQQKFQFYVELIQKIMLAIDRKRPHKKQLLMQLAERLEKSGDERICVEILFEAVHIQEKAREIQKMFERSKEKNGNDSRMLSSPDITTTEEKLSSLVKNLCEGLLGKFAAKLAEKNISIKLTNNQKELAKIFAERTRKWCQKMNNFEAQRGKKIFLPLIIPLHFWEMEKFTELALLFQLEIVERELPKLAVNFYRNAVRAVAKWEEGRKKLADEQSSGSTSPTKFAMKTDKKGDEWKVARKLFNKFFVKMAELGLDVHVNMDGRIFNSQIKSLKKQKPKIPGNFYWEEAMALSSLVIGAYNELELYRKAELRICTEVYGQIHNYEATDFFVVVGDIEYRYTDVGLVRKQFINQWENIEWKGQPSYTKIEPIVGLEMVEVEEAEHVFYEMLNHGHLYKEGYRNRMRNSHTFVYQFVCRLFKDKCPMRGGHWPVDFANNFDSLKEPGSEADVYYQQQLQDASEHAKMETNCEFQDVEFMFKLETKTKLLLPIILVSYTGGKMWNAAEQKIDVRHGGSFLVQSEADCIDDDDGDDDGASAELKNSTCKMTLKVPAYAKEAVLLTDVIFSSKQGIRVDEISKIEVFDLSFHANINNHSIINLEEKICFGAGINAKSPIESKFYNNVFKRIGGLEANDNEEGIYWRFPNVYPELSHITKKLTSVSPLGHHCAELALRVNWLFWWNLNETATRKEQDHWRQQLLKPDGLLDKIQPKNVQNFEACVRGVQQFVDWQLEQIGKGNLVLEEESEQFLRQIHGEMAALMGKHHYDAMQSSNKFFQSLKQKFQQKFQFYVELIQKILSAIGRKEQLKQKLLQNLADNMDSSERIHVGIIFDVKQILEKVREIQKMYELEHHRKKNGGSNSDSKDFSSPDIVAREEKPSKLIKNLCEGLLGNFSAKLADREVAAKSKERHEYLAQLFASYSREWCQNMQIHEAQSRMNHNWAFSGVSIWQKLKENLFMKKTSPELVLLLQLELMERELPELAVEFHSNAVRAVEKWKEGKEKPSEEQYSAVITIVKENEWKVARKLFNKFFVKMAEFGLNLFANMEGPINQTQMQYWGNTKNPSNFYWEEGLALSQLLINNYNNLELYKRAELRIRAHLKGGTGVHFTVLVGDIVYDYGKFGLQRRRTKVTEDKCDILDDGKVQKFTNTVPIVGMEMVVDLKETDRIFYEMMDSGYWPLEGLYSGMRNCHTFVYQFVCRLFNDKCPTRERWPSEYVNYKPGEWEFEPYRNIFDKTMLTSKHVQKDYKTLEEYREGFNVFRADFYQQLLDFQLKYQQLFHEQTKKEANCKLQDVEFMFRLESKTTLLLPIMPVSYTGGVMWNEEKRYYEERHGGTFNGQSEAECIEDDDDEKKEIVVARNNLKAGFKTSTCTTTMKVYVCMKEEQTEKYRLKKQEKRQQQQHPILLENVIFYTQQLNKICSIVMFDLSFHAKLDSVPIVNLDEGRCGGAGVDEKSPIEKIKREDRKDIQTESLLYD